MKSGAQLVDVMNEVWCSVAFAPKYVLRNVLSLLQGHYLLESDDGITINRDIWAVFGPEEIYMYISTALYCAYIQEQGYDFIIAIAILYHTSLVEGIREGF